MVADNKKKSKTKSKKLSSVKTKSTPRTVVTTSRAINHTNKILRLFLLGIILLILIYGAVVVITARIKTKNNNYVPYARKMILVAQEVVKKEKPTPPATARFYAYASSVFNDQLEKSNTLDASIASAKIMATIYPNQKDYIESEIKANIYDLIDKSYQNKTLDDIVNPAVYQTVLNNYLNRIAVDGHDLIFDGNIPSGDGKWQDLIGKGPLEPRAGEWKRWIVEGDFNTPAPPEYGSDEDQKQIALTYLRSAQRDATWVDKINFWGGTPGTEGPAGIWLNVSYPIIKDHLKNNFPSDQEKVFARQQSVLSQTLADAFMECWKVKYTYWTARPDMRDKNINTAMANPLFPSYVSGHSTISKAAADVLAIMYPAEQKKFENMAIEARDSRIYAGIHFQVDNLEGFNLGTEIASQIINKLELK